MVNNWIKQSDSRMLLLVLILISFNLIAFFTDSRNLLLFVEPLLLLLILISFFYEYPRIGLVLIGFLLFANVGDLLHLFNIRVNGVRLEAFAYCLGYLCLIYEAIHKIKKLNVGVLVGIYLVIVFGVNFYFLYILYDVLRDTITNGLELTITVIRIIFLLLFSLFSFTVYLSSESKQSILLLLMSIGLMFSDVLYLVTEYYMYYWVFDFIAKVLYVATFYCFYLYVVSHKKFSSPKTNFKEALTKL